VRKAYLAPVAVGIALVVVRMYLATAGSTPGNQAPLMEMEGVDALKTQFNRETSSLRVVILLSPSCPYCLKGASAIQRTLEKFSQHRMVVFVVWQPILPTDWGKPGSRVLHRLSDSRVRQFWDAGHHVAGALEQSFRNRDPQPNCCVHQDTWWDLMAVFLPGGEWKDTFPVPVLLEGTVDEAAPAFDAVLMKGTSRYPPAIAPTIRYGSAPAATASGSRASGSS
jgi:hypothetical protein